MVFHRARIVLLQAVHEIVIWSWQDSNYAGKKNRQRNRQHFDGGVMKSTPGKHDATLKGTMRDRRWSMEAQQSERPA